MPRVSEVVAGQRMGRDSNPRGLLHPTRFPGVRLKPLGHPSNKNGSSAAAQAAVSETHDHVEQSSGQGGIRTLDTVAGMPVFETGAFNRSATCPCRSHESNRLPWRQSTEPTDASHPVPCAGAIHAPTAADSLPHNYMRIPMHPEETSSSPDLRVTDDLNDDELDLDDDDDLNEDEDEDEEDEFEHHEDDDDSDFPRGDGTAETDALVHCPYCGESVEMSLDPGGGSLQRYVEDCEVCCRPWNVTVRYDEEGAADVNLNPLDE